MRKLHRRRGEAGMAEALRLMVSGRNISTAEAIGCGLVDEVVTEAAASPVEIAMERLRDYFAQQGPLAAAQEEHQKALAARDEAIPYSDSILEQPALQQALSQIRASGREKQVARVLDAVALGAEKGQAAGLLHEAELFAEAVCDPESGPTGITAFLEKRSAPLPTQYVEVSPTASGEQVDKLLASGFECRLAIIIFGYDYEDFPMDPAIDAFQLLAKERATLGEKMCAEFEGLVHPIHLRGRVFGWEILR